MSEITKAKAERNSNVDVMEQIEDGYDRQIREEAGKLITPAVRRLKMLMNGRAANAQGKNVNEVPPSVQRGAAKDILEMAQSRPDPRLNPVGATNPGGIVVNVIQFGDSGIDDIVEKTVTPVDSNEAVDIPDAVLLPEATEMDPLLMPDQPVIEVVSFGEDES